MLKFSFSFSERIGSRRRRMGGARLSAARWVFRYALLLLHFPFNRMLLQRRVEPAQCTFDSTRVRGRPIANVY